MPIDFQHPSSDVALNLLHSIVQQCQFNKAFPAKLQILDSDMKPIAEIRLISAEDISIRDAMSLIRGNASAHMVRIEPLGVSSVRCWVKMISSYRRPDERASVTRSAWDRNKGIDPALLVAEAV